MAVPNLICLLAFTGSVSAFAVRNDAQPNTTTVTIEPSTVDVSPGVSTTTSWKPKVHGESSAYGWDTATTESNSIVRIEATASDFDSTAPTTTAIGGSLSSIPIIDIGTIIQTFIPSSAWPILTIHFEDSASGWDDATSTVHYESTATNWDHTTSEAAHWEISATGWDQTGQQNLSPQNTRYKTVEVTDDAWTKNVRQSETKVLTRPQVTKVPSRVITYFPPPPAITRDGVTIRPVVVTYTPTITLPDGVVTTTEKIEFQVAVGSSTLSKGTPVTINDVVFDITTDAVGWTVLHAGDLTTTLPQPTTQEIRTVAGGADDHLSIVTSIVDGTTKYVLAGQTLAPGQPVTIGDIPISIFTSGSETVLYVGNKTTTLPATSDLQTITDWATVSSSTQGTAANTEPASAVPTKSSFAIKLDTALGYCFAGITFIAFST